MPSRPSWASPARATTTKANHYVRTYFTHFHPSARVCPDSGNGNGHARNLQLPAPLHRCRAGYYQCAGPDQYTGNRILAHRGGTAHHLSHRDADGGSSPSAIYPFHFTLRAIAGNRDLRGRHRHLLRPAACKSTHSGSKRAGCLSGIEPAMGPISTGLGEIFMWTVDAEKDARKPDGTTYTPDRPAGDPGLDHPATVTQR